MKAYLDTEFQSFDHPQLLSVGLVTDDGRELYLELTERARPKSVSTFVGDTVLTQFGLVPGAEVDSVEELGRRLGEWLLGLKSDLEVLYDFHSDMDILEAALKSAGLWASLESQLTPSHVGYMAEEEEAIQASEASWTASFAANGIGQHHALADARALKAAFHAVHVCASNACTNVTGQPDVSVIPDTAPLEIPAAQVAWFERTIQRLVDIMGDKDDDAGAPEGAPIIFLDIDDVLCLSNPYGGHDAIDAVQGRLIDSDGVLERLLHRPAVEVLHRVHKRLRGHVRYVVSSAWRQHLNRSELAAIMRRSGAGFVADTLERRDRWATPDGSTDGKSRLDEISEWLRRHGRGEPFAVVDDPASGSSLSRAGTDKASPLFGRIVLCAEGVGLLPEHAALLVKALQAPGKVVQQLVGQVDEPKKDVLSASSAGGQEQLRTWVDDGTLLPSIEFAHRRGWTTLGAHRARASGNTFTIEVDGCHYHVAVLAELPEPYMRALVTELAPMDKVQRLIFLLRKHGSLGGKSVAEAVAGGNGERVLELARAWCTEHGGRQS